MTADKAATCETAGGHRPPLQLRNSPSFEESGQGPNCKTLSQERIQVRVRYNLRPKALVHRRTRENLRLDILPIWDCDLGRHHSFCADNRFFGRMGQSVYGRL